MRLSSGDQFLVKVSADGGPFTTIRTLTAGTHSVVVEYYEKGGSAVMRLRWASLPAR